MSIKLTGFVAMGGLGALLVSALLVVSRDASVDANTRIASTEFLKLDSEVENRRQPESSATLISSEINPSKPLVSSRAVLTSDAPENTITVQVVDEDGVAIAGAGVCLVTVSELEKPVRRGAPWPRDSFADGIADERGEFVFEGVSRGTWRVWGGSRESYNHSSADLEKGSKPLTARISLKQIPKARLVQGVVLDTDGELADGASLEFQWNDGKRWRVAFGKCSLALGGFSIWTATDIAPGTLIAKDGSGQLRDAVVHDVSGGNEEIVVQLQAPRVATFNVISEGFVMNEAANVVFEVERYDRWARAHTSRPGQVSNDQSIQWMLPAVPFRIHANRAGYAYKIFGPFDPDEFGEHMQLEIVRLPRITGRVLAGGKPVSGVRITMPGSAIIKAPDNEGMFELASRFGKPGRVSAIHHRLGVVISDEIEIPKSGDIDVTLEFDRLGSLAGRVLMPDETEGTSQRTLYMHHNESRRETAVTLDLKGEFEIEHLAEGSWSLSLDETSTSLHGALIMDSATGEVRIKKNESPLLGSFITHVEVGKRTVVELDFRDQPICVLKGSILFAYQQEWGGPVGRCGNGIPQPEIRLLESSGSGLHSIASLVDLEYSLASREPGTYRVEAQALVLRNDLITFWRDIALKPGVNEWQLENVAGRIRVSLTSPMKGAWGLLSFKWSDGQGTFASGRFRGFVADGYEADAVVPSGRIEIYRKEKDSEPRLLSVVQVAPNEDRVVELSLD